MKDFKYRARFDSSAKIRLGSWHDAKASNTVFASANLTDLRSVLPSDEEIKENPDLLYSAFNAAAINLINMNDHGMGTETALAVSKYFKNKHMNVEHDKYDIVGHIINQAFSEFGTNKIIEASKLEGTTDPFNVVLGTVVYKAAREWFAELLQDSSNPSSGFYQMISASWEVAYNDYNIVLGSKKIKDAEIITDAKQIEEMSKYLRRDGGEGFMPDGTPVYLMISGEDVRPTGCAFTGSPASAVKGILVASNSQEVIHSAGSGSPIVLSDSIKKEILAGFSDILNASNEENKKNIQEIIENSSHKQKNTVIKSSIMNIKDITNEFLKTAEASAVRDFISEELSKKSDEFATSLKEKEDAVAAVTAEKETLANEKAKLESELQAAKDEAAQLKTKKEEYESQLAEQAKQAAFASRMESLEESYDLSDDQRASIAKQIADLDETAYASWEEAHKVFLAPKTTEPPVGDPLKGVVAEASVVPPNSSAPETNQKQKTMNTLKGVIKI